MGLCESAEKSGVKPWSGSSQSLSPMLRLGVVGCVRYLNAWPRMSTYGSRNKVDLGRYYRVEVASSNWLCWLGYLVKAMVTSRLSGNHLRYQIPPTLRTESLAWCGALHGRINGVCAASHKEVDQGAFGLLGTAKEGAGWLGDIRRSFPCIREIPKMHECSLRDV